MLDDLILQIDDYLRQFNQRFVYCGSISLYLNGCKEITKFNDIDVDYIDLTDKEKEWVKTTFSDDLPGDNVTITVDLIHPIAIEQGTKFSIREGGRTVGAGSVSKIIK